MAEENKKDTETNVDAPPPEPTGPAGRVTLDEISDLRIRETRLTSYMWGFAILGGLSALAALVLYVVPLATRSEYRYSSPDTSAALIPFVFFLCFGGATWAAASLRATYRARIGQLEILLKPRADEGEESQYFGQLVEINVTNLRRYYSLVESHTGRSFRAAIGAGVVGFLLILAGLIGGVVAKSTDLSLSYIATGAGVLSEFIASVFFYLYNRTVRQLKDYHESLVRVQNVLLALKLASDTKGRTDDSSLPTVVVKALLSQGGDGGSSS